MEAEECALVAEPNEEGICTRHLLLLGAQDGVDLGAVVEGMDSLRDQENEDTGGQLDGEGDVAVVGAPRRVLLSPDCKVLLAIETALPIAESAKHPSFASFALVDMQPESISVEEKSNFLCEKKVVQNIS